MIRTLPLYVLVEAIEQMPKAYLEQHIPAHYIQFIITCFFLCKYFFKKISSSLE